MKAQELRIGNFVLFDNKKVEITGIVKSGFYFDKQDFAINLLEWFQPIPLTEEWLLKFGFVKTPTKYYIGDLNDLCNRDLDLVLTTNKNIISYQDYLHPIHYVHSLQNLYFALTGKELTCDSH